MKTHIITAFAVIASLLAIAAAYDHLATDPEVAAALRAQKRLTDQEYYLRQIQYFELRHDLACKPRLRDQDQCDHAKRKLDEARKDYEKFLRGDK